MAKAEIRLGECGTSNKIYQVINTSITSVNGYVNCGFRPKIISLWAHKYNNNTNVVNLYYDADNSGDYDYWYNQDKYVQTVGGTNVQIASIDDNGFTLGYPQYWSNTPNAYLLVIG
jgi:hypothetical protein